MKSRRSRGFTLMEGLFALFMVAFVMGALANTLRQTAQIKKNTKNLDQEIEVFHLMMRIENDLNGSFELLEPQPGQSSEVIRLKRVDPALSYLARTDSSGDPENPYEPSETVTVEYHLEQGFLYRTVQRTEGPPSSSRVYRMNEFEATLNEEPPSILTVSTAVERDRMTDRRSLEIAVRVQP